MCTAAQEADVSRHHGRQNNNPLKPLIHHSNIALKTLVHHSNIVLKPLVHHSNIVLNGLKAGLQKWAPLCREGCASQTAEEKIPVWRNVNTTSFRQNFAPEKVAESFQLIPHASHAGFKLSGTFIMPRVASLFPSAIMPRVLSLLGLDEIPPLPIMYLSVHDCFDVLGFKLSFRHYAESREPLGIIDASW